MTHSVGGGLKRAALLAQGQNHCPHTHATPTKATQPPKRTMGPTPPYDLEEEIKKQRLENHLWHGHPQPGPQPIIEVLASSDEEPPPPPVAPGPSISKARGPGQVHLTLPRFRMGVRAQSTRQPAQCMRWRRRRRARRQGTAALAPGARGTTSSLPPARSASERRRRRGTLRGVFYIASLGQSLMKALTSMSLLGVRACVGWVLY